MFFLCSGKKSAALPTHPDSLDSQFGVCPSASLAHFNKSIYLRTYLVFSLLSPLPSHPAIPLAATWFLFDNLVIVAFVVSKCCQLSSGLWLSILCVHPQCPPRLCCLSHRLLILSVIFTLIFFSAVYSFIVYYSLPCLAFFLGAFFCSSSSHLVSSVTFIYCSAHCNEKCITKAQSDINIKRQQTINLCSEYRCKL